MTNEILNIGAYEPLEVFTHFPGLLGFLFVAGIAVLVGLLTPDTGNKTGSIEKTNTRERCAICKKKRYLNGGVCKSCERDLRVCVEK